MHTHTHGCKLTKSANSLLTFYHVHHADKKCDTYLIVPNITKKPEPSVV